MSFTLPIWASAQPSDGQSLPVFGAQHFTLSNGMDVILIENQRAPVVTHMVWYNVGAADEAEGQSGLAHFLEHLMFKGTNNLEPGEFSQTIRRLGGNDNAFTSQDYTAYFQTLSNQHLETVMQMEADRMTGLKLSHEESESERSVILEERRQTLESSPQRLFFQSLKETLFEGHPYAIPIIGTTDDIKGLSHEQIIRFYRQHYRPDQARLIVSGAVDLETLRNLAEQTYGVIETPDTPLAEGSTMATPKQPEDINNALTSKSTIIRHAPSIRQPLYMRIAAAPNWTQDPQASLALNILEELIAGGQDAPLYQTLVAEQKVASSVSLSYNGLSEGPAMITLSAYPSQDTSREELETAITAFLSKMQTYQWSAEDIAHAVTKLQDSAVYLRDSVTGPAMIIGRATAAGMTLDEIESWPSLLERVTAEDVSLVSQKWLPIAQSLDGWLLPEAAQATQNGKDAEKNNDDNNTNNVDTSSPEEEDTP